MKVLKKEKLFANSSYKKLFISSTAASFGDLFDMVAVKTLFTYVWHANSLWITLIPVAYALPSTLLSQAAGNLADRYDKVQLMFLSELVRLLFTCLLFFTNQPLLALGVLTLRSMSSVMKVPAQLAYVREVVKEDQLLQASTLQNIIFQIAKVVGPFLGAAALTITTPKACILVNAAACMISIGVLFSLKKAGKNIQGQAARSFHQPATTYIKAANTFGTALAPNRFAFSTRLTLRVFLAEKNVPVLPSTILSIRYAKAKTSDTAPIVPDTK